MPWRPTEPGEVPTLGWLVVEWVEAMLARPETQQYEPFILTREQAEFVLRFYELDPVTGMRRVRRGVISRPRGWGKSPFTACLAAVEALAPVVPAGWDADGQPVGRPWSDIRKPLVEIAAVSEDQVDTNTWSPLVDILSRGPVMDEYPGLEPMGGFINLPFGRIQKRTAAAGSAKGAPANFVVCDQTEEWVAGNGGKRLFDTLKNNVIKRGGHLIESPNAFTPGRGSVAEASSAAVALMRAGKTLLDTGLMYDHREAPPETSMTDNDSLLRGLAIAYGDSADVPLCSIHRPPCKKPGWVDLDHIRNSIWDPDADAQLSRSDWLNQITHASDSFVSAVDWNARADASKVVSPRDPIVLGFDGSRGRARGKADATVLDAVRVSDGHLFEIDCWEQPDRPRDPDEGPWEVDVAAVEAAVAGAFARYTVVGFYADPSMWDEHVASWEARYGSKLKVKATAQHPIRWPKSQMTRVVGSLNLLAQAIASGEMTHDGSYSLTRHFLNARRRVGRSGMYIAKEFPDSPNKIDSAYASMLAWQARIDAVSAGVGQSAAWFVPSRH